MYWLIARYALAASLGLAIGWTTQGWRKAFEIQSLKTEIAQREALQSEKALAETRQIRNETQRIIDRQADEIATLNLGLDRTLSQLRDRPARLPNPASDCKGTTGRELSRADAEFLIREAARADRLRSALKSCYEVHDAYSEVSR